MGCIKSGYVFVCSFSFDDDWIGLKYCSVCELCSW